MREPEVLLVLYTVLCNTWQSLCNTAINLTGIRMAIHYQWNFYVFVTQSERLITKKSIYKEEQVKIDKLKHIKTESLINLEIHFSLLSSC